MHLALVAAWLKGKAEVGEQQGGRLRIRVTGSPDQPPGMAGLSSSVRRLRPGPSFWQRLLICQEMVF
jgi:hypothetical protein